MDEKRKFWREGSLAAKGLTPEQKALAKKNRRKYDGDRKALESWAAGGFSSGLELENGRHARDEDVVQSKEEEEG